MHNLFWLKYMPQFLFDAEGGGGGAGDGGTGDASSDEGGAVTRGDLYRPEGLDEVFHGENDHETIDKLMAGLKDAQPTLPEDVSGYEFQPIDELKDYFGGDDPLMNAAKAAALSNGIAPEAFQNFINETFKDPIAQGMIAPPYDPKKEMDNLAAMLGGDAKTAEKAINDADAVASNIAKSLNLPDDASAFFEGLAETASGVMIIRAVQKMAGEKGIPLGGETAQSGSYFSKDELRNMADDQRLDPKSPKYDSAIEQKYNESYRYHYPD